MSHQMDIAGRAVGGDAPVFIVAEMSANHHQEYDEAVRILHAAKDAGADAVKLQTYTPDTMTIDSDAATFLIRGGTPWDGENLYSLYGRALTPWEWHPKLAQVAGELDLLLFSSPFDRTAVDFLEEVGVPVYKVASFELVDIPLLEYIAKQGKPVICSTGMGTKEEIALAVSTLRGGGAQDVALLKCTSAYPAPSSAMNLKTIPDLARTHNVLVGLSDHTVGTTVPVVATALGACIIEKHFTLSRDRPGPDSHFSLEPQEFKQMVEAVRVTEKALGAVRYGVSADEEKSRVFRRSLYVVEDVAEGEAFSEANVRSIRPGFGLPPKHLPEVLGRRAATALARGTPLDWTMIER